MRIFFISNSMASCHRVLPFFLSSSKACSTSWQAKVFTCGEPSKCNKVGGGVWLWRGKSSNPDEKKKGIKVAESCYPPGKTVTTLDQGINDSEQPYALFWQYLPGKVACWEPSSEVFTYKRQTSKTTKARHLFPHFTKFVHPTMS